MHGNRYYPFRQDFDQEYDNDCEKLVSGIVFYDDDSPLDVQLKVTMLQIYNSRLEQRTYPEFAVLFFTGPLCEEGCLHLTFHLPLCEEGGARTSPSSLEVLTPHLSSPCV